jgi:hypothetical protein
MKNTNGFQIKDVVIYISILCLLGMHVTIGGCDFMMWSIIKIIVLHMKNMVFH